jgi:hypothetical protein
MKYPTKFCNDVIRLFPENTLMHKCLISGNALLGRLLDDCTTDRIGVDVILAATSLEKLQGLARIEQEKRQLWHKFWRLDREQFHKDTRP